MVSAARILLLHACRKIMRRDHLRVRVVPLVGVSKVRMPSWDFALPLVMWQTLAQAINREHGLFVRAAIAFAPSACRDDAVQVRRPLELLGN